MKRDFIYSMTVVTLPGNDAIVDFVQQNTDGATNVSEEDGLLVVQGWLDAERYSQFYVMAHNQEGPFEGCFTTFKNANNWKETHAEHKNATVGHFRKVLLDKYSGYLSETDK